MLHHTELICVKRHDVSYKGTLLTATYPYYVMHLNRCEGFQSPSSFQWEGPCRKEAHHAAIPCSNPPPLNQEEKWGPWSVRLILQGFLVCIVKHQKLF